MIRTRDIFFELREIFADTFPNEDNNNEEIKLFFINLKHKSNGLIGLYKDKNNKHYIKRNIFDPENHMERIASSDVVDDLVFYCIMNEIFNLTFNI